MENISLKDYFINLLCNIIIILLLLAFIIISIPTFILIAICHIMALIGKFLNNRYIDLADAISTFINLLKGDCVDE